MNNNQHGCEDDDCCVLASDMHLQYLILTVFSGLKLFSGASADARYDNVALVLQSGQSTNLFDASKPWPILEEFDPFYDSDSIVDDETDEEDEDEVDTDDEDGSDADYEDEPAELIPDVKKKKKQKILRLPEEILKCGTSPFSPDAIFAAIHAGVEIIQQRVPWKNKPREQPHWYNNYEGFHFPDCTEGRMFEFPILIGGQVHRGGHTGSKARPGAHRVIFKADSDSGTFCGLITHEAAEWRGSFVACGRS